MRFLVDAQLPPALARLLTAHGHVTEHVPDIGPGGAKDLVLWRSALDNDAVIVTKDEDFPDMLLVADAALGDEAEPLELAQVVRGRPAGLSEPPLRSGSVAGTLRRSSPISLIRSG